MVKLNLSLYNIRNCEETTTFVKEFEKIVKCKKKGILNMACKQGLSLEKFKSLINLIWKICFLNVLLNVANEKMFCWM